MAGILASLQTAEVAMTTAKTTVLQLIAAANHRVKVHEISISIKGVVNTDAPVIVQVLRQTTAGTGGDALTAHATGGDYDETIQTTGLKDIDEAEPTGTVELMGEEVHPQGGFTWQAPFGKEIIVEGGGRLGIAVTAGVDRNCKARFGFEE